MENKNVKYDIYIYKHEQTGKSTFNIILKMAEKSGHRWKTRILHCIEPFVCFVSMILQIVGFSTNAWLVQETKLDGRLTLFGIWSATICYDLDCNTKTHMDEHKELMAKGFSARG
jgi:hypothetical protein